MDAKEILSSLFDGLTGMVKTETVIGKPFVVEGLTVVPISRVRIGFGVGSLNRGVSEKRGSLDSGGTGGALSIDPVALLVITKEGRATLYTVGEGLKGALTKAIDLVPELLDKIIGKKEE